MKIHFIKIERTFINYLKKSLIKKNVENLLFNENVEKFAFEITIEILFVANVKMLFNVNVNIIM